MRAPERWITPPRHAAFCRTLLERRASDLIRRVGSDDGIDDRSISVKKHKAAAFRGRFVANKGAVHDGDRTIAQNGAAGIARRVARKNAVANRDPAAKAGDPAAIIAESLIVLNRALRQRYIAANGR